MGRVQWLAVFLHCHLSAVVVINTQCYNGYCFIKPDPLTSGAVQKTFTDAQQWCCENDAMLLEIPDEHVQAGVQSYLSHNSFDLNPFLNAQFQQTNWTWADGRKYDNSWGAIQTGGNADSRCAYMTFNQANNLPGISAVTLWDTTPRAFICQYPGDQCPSGVSLNDGLCIEVNSSSSSWFGARLSCFQRGGDLASLHDIQSSSLVKKLQPGTEHWIGLINGQWIWQDSGTQMVYNNWQHGSPGSLTCLCLFNGSGLWTDCDCGSGITRPFICLQNGNSTSTSASRNSSCLGMSNLKSSSSHATSTSTSSQTTSFSKSLNQTKSTPESSNQTSSVGVAVGVSVGIILLILVVILAILLIVFRRRCQIGSLFTKLREREKSKEVPIYQDAADCQSPAPVLPPDTAFSNITYSSPKVGSYEKIHPPDNIYSEPDHDEGNKYSEVSFESTDVEAGVQPVVEYTELCDDAGVDETTQKEGVTSGNDVVRNSPYDNFAKEPVNSSSPSIELPSLLRNSGSNDDTILLDNELYS